MIKVPSTPRTKFPAAPSRESAPPRAPSAAVVAAPALVWGCALLVVASRLLFRSHYLYHWDSVNFAFSLLHFDVRIGQPHAPGYIVYVGLARLINAVVNDANLSMQIISALCSGLLMVVIWRMAERFFPERPDIGPIAALLVAVNPLLWFYGSVALPHALDALATTTVAFLCWRLLRGESRLLLPSALMLGVAGGIRQQDLVFLLPIWLYAARREGVLRIGLGLALTGIVCALWLWPMIAFSGGLAAYRFTVGGYSHDFFEHTSIFQGAGWHGLIYNVDRLFRFTLYAFGFVLLALLATVRRWRRDRFGERLGGERGWFLALWIAPSLLFYSLVHMGQHGLIFTFLPPLLLGSAALLAAAGRTGRAAAGAAALACTLIFVAAPEHLLPGERFKVLNAATLRNLDNTLERRFRSIRARFPADQTIIVTENYRHISYYLPEYPLVWPGAFGGGAGDASLSGFDVRGGGETFTVWRGRHFRNLSISEFPAATRTLVLLGSILPPVHIEAGSATITTESAAPGREMQVIHIPAASRIRWAGSADDGAFVIAPAQARLRTLQGRSRPLQARP